VNARHYTLGKNREYVEPSNRPYGFLSPSILSPSLFFFDFLCLPFLALHLVAGHLVVLHLVVFHLVIFHLVILLLASLRWLLRVGPGRLPGLAKKAAGKE